MTTVDHLYFALLCLLPIYGTWSHRRYLSGLARGTSVSRPQLYLQTQVVEGVLAAVLAMIWIGYGRPLGDLGFVQPGGVGFWIAALLTGLATGFLIHSWRAAARMPQAERVRQRGLLGDLVHFLPQSPRDLRHFAALSVSAGIVEETVYRGYLFWYLGQLMPLWAVVLVSSLAFAAGHSYQGTTGMARVFVVGLAFAGLYIVSGSIWLPIVLHALLDILQGAMLREINHDADERESTSAWKTPA